jgi:hypothetical protein
MRRVLSLAILFLIPVFGYAGSADEENLDRVIRNLQDNAIPFESYGGSSILIGNENDDETARGTFVFAVPLYAGFAVDTALALAERLRERNTGSLSDLHEVRLLIAFLPGDPESLSGLRYLVGLADLPENWILCYLDAVEDPERMVIRHRIRGYAAPLTIVKPLPPLFRSRGIPLSFGIRYNGIYRPGLVEGPEALLIAWEEEINGLALTGSGSTKKTGKTVFAPDFADLLIEYADLLEFPVMDADRHYSTFSFFGGRVFFLSEGLVVSILLSGSGVFLFLFLAYSVLHRVIMSRK